MEKMTAACVQFNHVPGDKTANLRKVETFAGQAGDNGIDLLVFPEMCITGYWHVRTLSVGAIQELAEKLDASKSVETLCCLAARNNITIGAGLIEVTADGDFYNTYVVAMPNGTIVSHRKLHCFINRHFKSGDRFTVFELPNGSRAGILICYDNNIGENVRINALLGAEILLAPHQTGGCITPSPHCMGGIDPQLWADRYTDPDAIEAEFRGPKGREWLLTWLPARAHDNGLFILFSNGVGVDDNEVRTGNAMILDPYGRILAETWKADERMVSAELDPELLQNCTGRRWIATRRPELYSALSQRTGLEKDIFDVRFGRQRAEG